MVQLSLKLNRKQILNTLMVGIYLLIENKNESKYTLIAETSCIKKEVKYLNGIKRNWYAEQNTEVDILNKIQKSWYTEQNTKIGLVLNLHFVRPNRIN